MKFKNIFTVILLLSSFFVSSGCNSSNITEEEAIQTVKSEQENDGFGKINIISVTHKRGEYAVKWERKSNCESGMDYISDRSGKITHGEHSIC
jgi:hypothetical protein